MRIKSIPYILFTNEVHTFWASFGLLFLRVYIGAFMFFVHGLPKLLHFQEQLLKLEDPFHMGAYPTLILTMLQETGLSLLLIGGLATRFTAVPMAFTMMIAGFIVHGDWSVEMRQFIFLYLMGFITLILTGPGSFSFDDWIKRKYLR